MVRIHRRSVALFGLPALLVVVAAAGCSIEPNPTPFGDGKTTAEGTDSTGAPDPVDPTDIVNPPPWDATDGTDSTDGTGHTDATDTTDSTDATDSTDVTDVTDPPVTPVVCSPSCDGLQCGPDGCGGACGWCAAGHACQSGSCGLIAGCEPDCAGQMIGVPDGCGGVCSGSGLVAGLGAGGAQDAAYFRAQVASGVVPSPDALPIEGWLTEHGTPLPPAQPDRLVTLHGFVGLVYDPAEGEPTVALQLGMNSGLSAEALEAGRLNLCVVIAHGADVAHVKQGLVNMLDLMDGQDWLSIVTAATGQVLLEPTKVSDKAAIAAVIDGIQPGGGAAGPLQAGLVAGYKRVMQNIGDGELTSRVLLLSGGMTPGTVESAEELLAATQPFSEAGIGLTTIGLGAGVDVELLELLATAGGGNFYFLAAPEKLAQVFALEAKALLTPIADNLSIWFSLPQGFHIQQVYGFEYDVSDDSVDLLGPSPRYSVAPGTSTPPGAQPPVAVSTYIGGAQNGLLMVRLKGSSEALIGASGGAPFTTLHYSYDLAESGTTEAWDTDVSIGSLEYDSEDGFHYFSDPIVHRNMCILRAGLAMKTAAALYADDPVANLQEALSGIAYAVVFCEGINLQLADPKLVEDLALMKTLMDNICGGACADPATP